jgi:hypothetical protein
LKEREFGRRPTDGAETGEARRAGRRASVSTTTEASIIFTSSIDLLGAERQVEDVLHGPRRLQEAS